MTMMVDVIAMLLSFAMMLTGAGGAGQPAEASRTLVVRDVSLTYDGETVELAPSLRLGVSTDGEKAVFDFGIDRGEETLMPIQLGVSQENGVTALFESSDIAVNVPSGAISAAMEQANAMLEGMMGQVQTENPELIGFLTEEFVPAYSALLSAAMDPEYASTLTEKGNAIFDAVIDRGEGTPVTEVLEGQDYALTEYNYTIDGAQMSALIDGLCEADELFGNYYAAMFKLYAMMPEESGLNQITSFDDLFNNMGMEMTMEVSERISDDREVDLMDSMLTLDMSGFVAKMAESAGEDAQVPEIPPIVMDITSELVNGEKDATVNWDYEVEGSSVAMTIHAADNTDGISAEMDMDMSMQGEEMAALSLSCFQQETEDGGKAYEMNMGIHAAGQGDFELGVEGVSAEDGTSQNSVSLSGENNGKSFALSFALDVTADAIEDLANGHEPTLAIDDLSQEALNKLNEDETFSAALMQVVGSLSMDAQKLATDEGIVALTAQFQGAQADYDYNYDESGFDVEDEEINDYEYEEEEVEDDGILPFDQPEFNWLPEGWSITDVNVDTAFDWVDVSISDETGENTLYAIFFSNQGEEQTNYIVSDKGEVTPVEGREISVSAFDEGGASVTLQEGGVYANLMFYSVETIDMETIGQVVAGIAF